MILDGAGEASQPSPTHEEPGPYMNATVFPAPEDNGTRTVVHLLPNGARGIEPLCVSWSRSNATLVV
ncbi:hypothetical protein [Conexivisphaera calida]|uniref:hypothetical protein n=1 Tax=Conexivisphaera calida TaxID=1874277 RepID=UPI00157B56D4|nr:hypothetical protein [Conexivisphaera calida]